MPNTSTNSFYVVGGTVNPDSPSYVVRQADQELFDRVLAGEFCYVLTSRQMGKSSLMARTARRLATEAHVHTAIVDLTQIGGQKDDLTAEQWFYGIAHRLLRELKLRDVDLQVWWQARAALPALQRLTEFFSDLLLERLTGQIVIFIDEIDSTISLPFTDDFFAAIRACYNARAIDTAYQRLSFVLLGVAAPSDLMKDSKRTPFNIGHRIELTDFSFEESKPLTQGLSPDKKQCEQALLRILYWTGGHPYLTQKLCYAAAQELPKASTDTHIDLLVERYFLSSHAKHEDSNLEYVQNWLTHDRELGWDILELYRRIYRGEQVADSPLSPIYTAVKLSGVVKIDISRQLLVRNRIYQKVFTDDWAKESLRAVRRSIFISYARSDGYKFADQLRQRLETENILIWRDTGIGMEGGRDWWLQLTEAIDHVEFMLLVVTPNALNSPKVRKEWRYARQQGVCVFPIKGTPNLDFNSLPRWLRDVHFYDPDPDWANLLNDLHSRCQARRIPFMAEDLPEDFVVRLAEFDSLVNLLIDQRHSEPIAITAALRGAGGYGKTTMAKALCHNEAIQDTFDDGILWVTLGENPSDLTKRVEDLIYALSGELPGFTNLEAAIARLTDLLADRDILIVIDDVWNNAHLRPFLQGGPRCARLITTRNLDLLPGNAQKIHVDAMRQEEAVALLSAGLAERDDFPAVLAALNALARRLGNWPLLLKLVNGVLRNRTSSGESLETAINFANRAMDKQGLVAFDERDASVRSHAVSKTLGATLELLSTNDRARYYELVIFPEDVNIPLVTLEKLWGKTGGLDELETEKLCNHLYQLSLLQSFDLAVRCIGLHPLLRTFLLETQRDNLTILNNHLLDAYRSTLTQPASPGGVYSWANMPDNEPYLWDHLIYHLIEAGNLEELVSTVKDISYLAKKTFLRKSRSVESDLLKAKSIAPDDTLLHSLRRYFATSGNLLDHCDTLDNLYAMLLSEFDNFR